MNDRIDETDSVMYFQLTNVERTDHDFISDRARNGGQDGRGDTDGRGRRVQTHDQPYLFLILINPIRQTNRIHKSRKTETSTGRKGKRNGDREIGMGIEGEEGGGNKDSKLNDV